MPEPPESMASTGPNAYAETQSMKNLIGWHACMILPIDEMNQKQNSRESNHFYCKPMQSTYGNLEIMAAR